MPKLKEGRLRKDGSTWYLIPVDDIAAYDVSTMIKSSWHISISEMENLRVIIEDETDE